MKATRLFGLRKNNFLIVLGLLVICLAIFLRQLLSIFKAETSSSQAQPSRSLVPTGEARVILPPITPTLTNSPDQNLLKPTIASVSSDELFSTIPEKELIDAINSYRQVHQLRALKTNEGLCQEARARAEELYRQNIGVLPPFILNHNGFWRDLREGVITKLSGLTFIGENIASANCRRLTDNKDIFVKNATQLVEWCFDSSAEHRENLLRADWTDVCSSGRYPFYVEIFGK